MPRGLQVPCDTRLPSELARPLDVRATCACGVDAPQASLPESIAVQTEVAGFLRRHYCLGATPVGGAIAARLRFRNRRPQRPPAPVGDAKTPPSVFSRDNGRVASTQRSATRSAALRRLWPREFSSRDRVRTVPGSEEIRNVRAHGFADAETRAVHPSSAQVLRNGRKRVGNPILLTGRGRAPMLAFAFAAT